MLFTVVAFLALLLAVAATLLAVIVNPRFYWAAALGIYVFSFLAGFSIGQFTVALTVLFLALAVGYSSGKIRSGMQFSVFSGIGILLGIAMVAFVDDYWIFYPIWALLPETVLS